MKNRWWSLCGLLMGLVWSAAGQNVVTYHNDNARTGRNLAESALTPRTVNATQFGKRFAQAVDGQVYAQPLYLRSVNVPGKGSHNVVYIATEHDSVYAFDADNNQGANASPLWQVSFLGPGVTTFPAADVGCDQITPEMGITGTPVIDTGSGTIYFVATTKETSGSQVSYVHRLHALDVTNGAERPGSPVVVQGSVQGTGDGGTSVDFIPKNYKQRPGLLLLNGVVYTAWSSHCDAFVYHGWVFGHDARTLQRVSIWNATPNGSEASFWNSGAGPAADANGNIFIMSGNGTFDADRGGVDYGDAIIRLSTANNNVTATSFFTPYNQQALSDADIDLGSGGGLLLPDEVGSAEHRRLLVGAGKDGVIYMVDRDNLGGFHPQDNGNAVQVLNGTVGNFDGVIGPSFGMPAYFGGNVYFGGVGDRLKTFSIANARMSTDAVAQSATTYAYPGTTPSVSANGAADGIVWAIENSSPAKLHAYDATNVANQLYDSGQNAGRDAAGGYVKFTVPTVADGKVFVPGSSSVTIYGLLASSCQYRLSINTVSVGANSGSFTIGVQTEAGCAWQAASTATWLSGVNGASGSGPGLATVPYASNNGAARSATVTLGGQSVTVSQAAPAVACSYTFTPVAAQVPASASTGSFLVGTNSPACAISPVSNAPWLTAQVSGATVQYSVSANVSGSVRMATLTQGNQNFTVTQLAPLRTAPPFGAFDLPADGASNLSGAIQFGGWALDDTRVASVKYYRDPVPGEPRALIFVGDMLFVAGTRPDVQAAFGGYPYNDRAGWGALMLSNTLPNSDGSPGRGNGTYRFHVMATDDQGNTTEIGVKTLSFDNSNGPAPFGTIDLPAPGEVVSGTYVVQGWALTRQPYVIPTDGSTFTLFLDGAPLPGPVLYNFVRPDIQVVFPGYANTNGAAALYVLDTTRLTNGVHSIEFAVTDNGNRRAGIGSRYFFVLNGSTN